MGKELQRGLHEGKMQILPRALATDSMYRITEVDVHKPLCNYFPI